MASSILATPACPEEIRGGLDRVLNSETFRRTPSLRHLLEYLVTRTIEGYADQIKESIIAIDVFSRPQDFDGRVDNIVRVQAHRLRKLLETYYGEEGRDNKIRFSVPKGSYIPQIEARETPPAIKSGIRPADSDPALAAAIHTGTIDTPVPVTRPSRPLVPRKTVVFLAGMAAGALLLGLLLLGVLRNAAPESVHVEKIAPAVNDIWKVVFEPGVKVIASFTNPAFLSVRGFRMLLRYEGPLSAPPGAEINLPPDDPYIEWKYVPKGAKLHYNENWTGTGEVLAVSRLSLLGAQFRSTMTVLPSRSLSLNDMHGANVIFVGSPWVNGALARIGSTDTPFSETNDGRIVVRQPVPGEQPYYSNQVNEATKALTRAYSLFSVLPGMDSGRSVVFSAGLGTAATWAGIDFTTSPTGAAQLERALKAVNGGKLPRYYQAIIRSDIVKGAEVNPTLVTVRVIPPPQ
jgi:hypothetical protein